ncbi:MAG TPA: hypothetical protein VNT79_11515 [Phycisphaerae bacterium]|nr:hypothetical protein [Phycisphaerae bacterium]
MHDNRNFIIGVLSVTATILFVGLLIVTSTGQNQAMAIGQIDRGGDYILVTGQFTENTELVYVVDAASRRMISYSYETSTRDFVLWDAIDLARIVGTAEENPPRGKRGR